MFNGKRRLTEAELGGSHLPLSQRFAERARCRANMAHIRQSKPDAGLGCQVKVLQHSQHVPSSLGSGSGKHEIDTVVFTFGMVDFWRDSLLA